MCVQSIHSFLNANVRNARVPMRERESSNPGAKTIEEELQRALTAAGAISIENSTSLQKVGRSLTRRNDRIAHRIDLVAYV